MSSVQVLEFRRRRGPERARLSFRHCGMCGAELGHANWIGHHVGTVFVAKGYFCFSCGFQEGARIVGKTAKGRPILFDWRRIVSTQGIPGSVA